MLEQCCARAADRCNDGAVRRVSGSAQRTNGKVQPAQQNDGAVQRGQWDMEINQCIELSRNYVVVARLGDARPPPPSIELCDMYTELSLVLSEVQSFALPQPRAKSKKYCLQFKQVSDR
ncbi:hypothetical protein NDU88_007817 [Pleurodeles waltl]|uniref:Uncharacterized protein n=1 Tax=Pleurodeles waltl TaxID=8319 RepID=A0AAV7N337_PLEWA|nr:hypothetical protein NDU88_007817 [Pleurodeles waltl]